MTNMLTTPSETAARLAAMSDDELVKFLRGTGLLGYYELRELYGRELFSGTALCISSREQVLDGYIMACPCGTKWNGPGFVPLHQACNPSVR